MDKSDIIKSFETILKTHNDKKPLAVYCTEENDSTSLPSKILKPQDVIATVSNQLRDIQNADSLKKGCTKHVRSRQAGFLPINDLYSQECFQNQDVTNFQTQCVTDTQLIDIVDNVEAMVNMNMDFEGNTKEVCERHIVNFRSRDNNITTGNNFNKGVKHFCQLNNQVYINEINTDIYKEFNTSYSGNDSDTDDKNSIQNSNKETSVQQCNGIIRINVDSINDSIGQMCKDHGDCDKHKSYLPTEVIGDIERKPFKDKYNELFENNIEEQQTENTMFQNNNNLNEVDWHTKNNFRDRFYTDTNIEIDCNLSEKHEVPSSPVLKSFKLTEKSKILSPLTFPLDSFEKFESLAMPVIKENTDLERAKHLINSQIIDNQLRFTVNTVPILENPIDNLKVVVSNDDTKVIENVSNSNSPIETLADLNEVVKKSTSFEDEILFSSDEENDNIQYDENELPQTCALKTSFNDSEVDLDETVFVGFQTSSDKCIQVRRDSFIRAKNMLDTIDKEKNVNITFTELVDIYDSHASLLNNNVSNKHITDVDSDKEYEKVNNFTKDVLNLITTHSKNHRDTKKAEFIGFKTANGKSIVISETALQKCSNIFNDIEEDTGFGTKDVLNPVLKKKLHSKTTYREHVQLVEAENISKCVDLLDKSKPDINHEYVNIVDQTLLQEFENESIEEAINCPKQTECKALEILNDFKNTEVKLDKSFGVPKNKKNHQLFCDKGPIDDSDVQEQINPRIFDCHSISRLQKTPEFLGFKTANNKEIKISSEALAKTKDLFHDVGFDDLNKHEIGLYHKRQNDFEELDIDNDADGFKESKNPLPIFQGFKTASNKAVNISKEALLKSERLFKDMDSFSILKDNKEAKGEDDPNDMIKNNHYSSLSFQGFKTASNKPVNVTKESVAKSKKIFEDMLGDVPIKLSNHVFNGNNLEAKYPDIQNSNSQIPKKMNNEITCYDISSSVIRTDANTNIISVTGLKKTEPAQNTPINILKLPLNNMMIERPNEDKHIDIIVTNKISGLSECDTASDKEIVISKEVTKGYTESEDIACKNSFSHNKHGNENVDHWKTDFGNFARNTYISGEQKHDTHAFIGFQTASNKRMKISHEAIERSRKIFDDLNFDVQSYKNEYQKTSFSHEKTNKEQFCEKDKAPSVFGFKTATNKRITVSEDALKRSKQLFLDLDNDLKKTENENSYEDRNKGNVECKYEKEKAPPVFGFKTATNKRIKVSEDALKRSKQLFIDLDNDLKKTENENSHEDRYKGNIEYEYEKEKGPPVFGFKTATNKRITVSEDAIKRSKQLFLDLDNDLKKTEKENNQLKSKKQSVIDLENNINICNTIDTQILNNFEETLHTEDFYNDVTPKQAKRSASPILSCPKAKKRRKFETPYRNDRSTSNIQNDTLKSNKQSDMIYTFSDYKKTKLYSLNDLHNIDKIEHSASIDPYILNFDFDSLLKFQFGGSRNDFTDVIWTTDNIKTCFIESVDSKIIPEGWLDNHLKLILWKLISYEIRFPNVMRNICSVKNVLEQLKYRYDKELHRVERPALRKLLEKDDISTRTMILAVVGVYIDGVKVKNVTSPSQTIELLVTDGWYCIMACTDRMMSRLVSEGKIAVGTKIATVGAELLNCEQGVSPWENTSAVRLKLFGNSTRPAHWHARLGFHTNGSILTQLSTIDPSGGKVYKTRAVVVRVYPALYVEKLEDGNTVTRSERLEHLHQIKYESERQTKLEKLYEELEKEFYDQESSESEGMDTDMKRSYQSGSQLNRLMKKSNDPTQFRSHLSDSQALLLQEYSSRKKEKIVEELQKRVQDKIRAQGLQISRNVIPLLKIRVAGFEEADSVKASKAMVSIWRPNDEILEVLKEGAWIDMFNVFPTAVRNSEIHISAGRQSVFHRSKYKPKDNMKPYIESLQRKCFTIKDLSSNPTMHTEFNEIDTVGIVFLIEPSVNDFETSKGQQFQNVYLTDVDKNFVCINFWGGIKKFGFQNIFDTGNVVACMNLQKRVGNTRKNIPQYRATELSIFTKTPKLDHVRNMTEELIKKMSGLDKRKFYDDCISIKNNYTIIKNTSEFSPYRFNTSDYSLIKNKMFIDSPLAQNKDVNLNLTGLDFESTFQQSEPQEMSPTMLKRKQLVKEKIAKLEMYGEPPPLSKIHIVNKSKYADSAYKSPLTRNVARAQNAEISPVTTNKLVQDSPVLAPNRIYIRSGVNPVKLKFFASDVSDDKVESNPFEEEFEASPPLSLE